MTKEQFIEKYSTKFGCENASKVCWCTVCTALERAWEDVKSSIVAVITKE